MATEDNVLTGLWQSLSEALSTLLWPLVATWNWIAWRIRYVQLGEKLPGPRNMPLLGVLSELPILTAKAVFEYLLHIDKVYLKYPCCRLYIGPQMFIYTREPKDFEKILSGYSFLDKGIFYKFLHPWLAQGLLTSTGEKWRRRRKALTPTFHFNILEQFIPVFNNCSDVFIQQLEKFAGKGGFDIWNHVKLLTLDVICETAMGVKMEAQTNSKSEYVTSLNALLGYTTGRMIKPWQFFDFLFWLSHSGREYKKHLAVLHGTTDRVIRERRTELQNMTEQFGLLDVDEIGRRRRVAFLDLLILMSRDGSLSDMDIREEVDTFMFEGHDTSSAGISFTIFMLSQHQDVQQKVVEELQGVFDASQPVRPNSQQLAELKYLEMVIKETLRLYPPVAAFSREVQEECTLPGSSVTIPSGCSTLFSPFTLHRHDSLFPNAEKFDPERFSPDECARRHPFAYLPFSAGPRNCIGQRFAMMELKSVIAKLVWNYRILPEPGFEPEVLWEIILKSANGLFVRLEKRDHD